MTQDGSHGVLLAIMEPDQSQEEEFNDWYDLEHIPQMSGVEGILTATRWVAVEGWPRYLAVYDLETVEVLKSDSYRGATGGHFTPWTRRLLERARGWRRIALAGVSADAGVTRDDTGALDLLLLDSADAARDLAGTLVALPGIRQARSFDSPDGGQSAVVAEAGALADLVRADAAPDRPGLAWSGRYVRYERNDPFAAFRSIDAGETH
jgi:hypothetical protein